LRRAPHAPAVTLFNQRDVRNPSLGFDELDRLPSRHDTPCRAPWPRGKHPPPDHRSTTKPSTYQSPHAHLCPRETQVASLEPRRRAPSSSRPQRPRRGTPPKRSAAQPPTSSWLSRPAERQSKVASCRRSRATAMALASSASLNGFGTNWTPAGRSPVEAALLAYPDMRTTGSGCSLLATSEASA
jgi:hypothetical protein